MVRHKRSLTVLTTLAVLLPAPALAASTATPEKSTGSYRHALLTSPELWATIDVCNPPDQPNTVGIRGSMPGDHQSHDKMYMSFRLQYLSTTTMQWVDLLSGETPSFVAVGNGAAARQDGRSFKLVPGKSASTLRGVVDFQWRRGSTVLLSVSRPTTAGRDSLAGADPAGFSAASCVIGA